MATNKEQLVALGGFVVAAVIEAAREPLAKIAIALTRSLFARLSPSHENNTVTAIEKAHEQKRLRRQVNQEHLEQLEARATAFDEILALKAEEHERRLAQVYREAEERRLGHEIEQAALERKTEERKIAQEIEDRRLSRAFETEERRKAELHRKTKERAIAQEVEDRKLAREIEDKRLAELEQKTEEERRIAPETAQSRITDLVRESAERRLEQARLEESTPRTPSKTVRAAKKKTARKSKRSKTANRARQAEQSEQAAEIETVKKDEAVRQTEENDPADRDRELEEVRGINAQKIGVANEISKIREAMSKADQQPEETDGIPGVPVAEYLLAKEKIGFCPGQFRFAVSGASGTGKSSLINNFLDLNDNHKDAARIGINETTSTIGRYPDPGDQPPRKWTVWYDIPGSGTFTFRDENYFNQQCLYMFDLVLVVYNTRFLNIHSSIIRDCNKFKVPSFIVRTSTDTMIKNCMYSNGYDIDDDNDPETTKELNRKSREQVIAETQLDVEMELEKAGLPWQRVYMVSRSKEFRRAYAASIDSTQQPTVDDRGTFVDERELIHDLLAAATKRRCDIEPKPASPITGEPIADRERLISRLRTGNREVQIKCHCEVSKKDVEHILLKCSLTKRARSKARKELGDNKLTRVKLLYDAKYFEWAEKIWQEFMEARETMG